MNSVKSALKILGGKISKNSPQILTALGCAGVISTAILAVRGTPKAIQILEKYHKEHGEKPSQLETIQLTWKNYIPAAIVGATSIGCIIGATSINERRNAVLSLLYSMSESTLRDYKSKVIETIGQKKEQNIRDEIDKDCIDRNPPSKSPVIFTGYGEHMCYDKLSGRYFKSNYEKIRQVVNDLNFRLRNDNWISLNDLYYELGLDDIALGYQVGFDIDKGQIEPTYSSHLAENGQPCLVMDVKVYPMYTR